MTKKTLVLGASPNPARYSYLAALSLQKHGHEVLAVGKRNGNIGEIPIATDYPIVDDIDTMTLYVGAKHQPELYDYILEVHPKRIIFNPGTENPVLVKMARGVGIETVQACTMVMLSVDKY